MKYKLVGMFHGRVANPGKFSGVAVVLGPEEQMTSDFIDSLPERCVLVAESTHPHYLPIMSRCIAFVTEEGGLLSHAAITAREWGIPCVVGVSGILNVVRTGDFVVGDEDGTIRVYRGN